MNSFQYEEIQSELVSQNIHDFVDAFDVKVVQNVSFPLAHEFSGRGGRLMLQTLVVVAEIVDTVIVLCGSKVIVDSLHQGSKSLLRIV